MGWKKIYTDEELKERKRKQRKICRDKHKYYKNTLLGRANVLNSSYKASDKKYNRGEGDLTSKWIVDNILSKPCVHCGETDWHKLGCNRLDNSKPHTMDNVEPCCFHCNCVLGGIVNSEERKKRVYQYTINKELIAIYNSVAEASEETSFGSSSISLCCRGGCYRNGKWENVKSYKGYIWSYEPL